MFVIKKSINFFTLAIALMPILNTYRFIINGFGVGDLFVLLALMNLVLNKHHLGVEKKHISNVILLFYAIIISLINVILHLSFSVRDIVVRLFIFAYYVCVICIPKDEDFDREVFCDLFVKIATVCCIYVIIQFIAFHVFKKTILGVLPGIPLNYSIKNYSELLSKYSSMYLYFYRPTSFFPEPSYFAQFMGPALMIVLFGNIVRKKIFYAIFFSISALLSTSTNALVIVGVSWLCYLGYETFSSKGVKKILRNLVIILLICMAIFFVSRISETFIYGFARIQKLLDGNAKTGSVYERVLKGFDIWKQLDFTEKIFGIGFGTYDSYYALGKIHVFNGEVEYMSSLTYILVSGGIIGLTLFIAMLLIYMDRRDFFNIALIILIFLLFLSSSIFNSPTYAILMLLLSHKNRIKEASL